MDTIAFFSDDDNLEIDGIQKGSFDKWGDGYYRFTPTGYALTCRDCRKITAKLSELNTSSPPSEA